MTVTSSAGLVWDVMCITKDLQRFNFNCFYWIRGRWSLEVSDILLLILLKMWGAPHGTCSMSTRHESHKLNQTGDEIRVSTVICINKTITRPLLHDIICLRSRPSSYKKSTGWNAILNPGAGYAILLVFIDKNSCLQTKVSWSRNQHSIYWTI